MATAGDTLRVSSSLNNFFLSCYGEFYSKLSEV